MPVDRRAFLKTIGFAGAAAAVPTLLGACAKENEPTPGAGASGGAGIDQSAITLVSLYGTSGLQAELGKEATEGIALVPEQAGGKLLDRPLKVVTYDTQEKIDEAVRRARETASSGARYYFGGLLSNVALALSEEVNKNSGVFVTPAGADEITGKECRSSTFRWSVATYGAVQETVRPLLEREPSLKRWYTITPDYVFGQSLLSATKQVLKERGAEHAGNSFHALDATEFSGYVNNAVAARPDVLCLLNFGAQSTTTIKQAVSFGVKEKMTILLVWGGGLSQFRALGADTMEGVYAGCQYWHTADTPGNRKFVELFRKRYDKAPSYIHGAGYITSKLVVDAVAKAGSADAGEVVKALEGLQYEGLTGQEQVRPGDHQVIKDYYLLKGRKQADMQDQDDLMEIVSSGKTALPLEKTGCTLKPLGS